MNYLAFLTNQNIHNLDIDGIIGISPGLSPLHDEYSFAKKLAFNLTQNKNSYIKSIQYKVNSTKDNNKGNDKPNGILIINGPNDLNLPVLNSDKHPQYDVTSQL